MPTIVVFHSALGRRPAVEALATTLRADGHEVVTPDLFDGRVLDDLDAGVAERDRIGIPELIDRALAAVEDLPGEVAYVGLSMGTGPAQLLATTRPGARGAALVQGALPLEAIGVERWPSSVPLQLHTSPGDPWQDEESTGLLLDHVPPALREHHEYPGCGHLFMDPGLPAHDPHATDALIAALRAWLARI